MPDPHGGPSESAPFREIITPGNGPPGIHLMESPAYDSTQIFAFKTACERLADRSVGQNQALIDFGSVTILPSPILGHLFLLFRKLESRGTQLRFRNVQPSLRQLFGIVGLDRVIPIDGGHSHTHTDAG